MHANRLALASLLVLPLAAAGCGSSTPAGGTTSAAGSSSSAAPAGASSAYEMCAKPGPIDKDAYFEMAKKNPPKDKTAHMEGTLDMDATGSGTKSALALAGDVDATDQSNPRLRMTMDFGGTAMEMLLLDKTSYIKMGQMTDGKYAKMSLSDLGGKDGVDFSTLSDPQAQLEKSKDAITAITCVGREDLDGTKTAHLKVTTDTAKAAKAVQPSGSATPTGTAKPSGTASMPATVDSEMWMDEGNRPLKMKMDMGQTGGMSITYSKWGEKVDIAAPPSAQVTEMPGLGGQSKTTPTS